MQCAKGGKVVQWYGNNETGRVLFFVHAHTRTYTFGPYKTMAQTCVNDADSGGENQFSKKTIYKCKYRGVLSHIAVSYFTRKHTDEFVKRNYNVAVDATQNANLQTIQM